MPLFFFSELPWGDAGPAPLPLAALDGAAVTGGAVEVNSSARSLRAWRGLTKACCAGSTGVCITLRAHAQHAQRAQQANKQASKARRQQAAPPPALTLRLAGPCPRGSVLCFLALRAGAVQRDIERHRLARAQHEICRGEAVHGWQAP